MTNVSVDPKILRSSIRKEVHESAGDLFMRTDLRKIEDSALLLLLSGWPPLHPNVSDIADSIKILTKREIDRVRGELGIDRPKSVEIVRPKETYDLTRSFWDIRKDIIRLKKITFVFDFDGTISLLRREWPYVMGAFFSKILGEALGKDEKEMRPEVDRYVESSIGIETIFQTEWLARRVRDAGKVSKSPVEYKHAYLKILEERMRHSKEDIERDPSSAVNWLVPGFLEIISYLNRLDPTPEIWIASGTDTQAVQKELSTLKIEGLDRIVGAVDRAESPKRKAIQEACALGPTVVVGDGPTEIRYALEFGGLPVGIAFDESRKMLDPQKRRRLMAAGAWTIAEDHLETLQLVKTLFEMGPFLFSEK